MRKYGINNVRGGTFCKIKLTEDNRNTINKMINSVTDKCYTCGEKGHYASECKNSREQSICYRCNRTEHHKKDCYAKTDINGDLISENEEESYNDYFN